MFNVGDVIQHPSGGAKYRIVLIEEEQNAYKVVRLDNGFNTMIGIDKGYVITDPPPNETKFQVGQVLLQKIGTARSARVCIVLKCYPAIDSRFNGYDTLEIQQYEGGCTSSNKHYLEHELIKGYTTKNLKWLLFNGSPLSVAQDYLKSTVEKMDREIKKKQREKKDMEELLSNLKFFEKEEK